MTDPLIEVAGVSFAYAIPGGGRTVALSDVSLAVHEGEFLAVIGHNGSGKSTLAKLFNGLLIPRRGEVRVAGMSTRDASLHREIRQMVGVVFQDPEDQIVATLVEEDVAFGPENLGLPRDEVRRRVEASIEAVEVGELRLRPPHQLSGGQKQRVAIAGVLAMRPRCIVLDESTAMLDPEGRREVLAVVRRLHQAGTTIILVTHFMSEAALAERIVVLADGRIELQGSPREVFGQRDRLRELDLDVPLVTAVAERGRAAGVAIKGLPLTIDEFVAALP
ncbi:MAG: energy-coupling factor transporter ATPase [Candidatus Limnocylindria bacterium]